MAQKFSPAVRAVLGPTNTGKTHLAVERMCAHSSGMMGFPLRLLAREIYDRMVAIKGERQVALVTGEERIIPPDARYILGTIEALPVQRDVAFVAVDEVQMGADAERGHMFTDRLLRARGREETLLLGSASATGVVRALLPDAEIVGRPRFSTLSYVGPSKLSRLPKRSAIVAFSAEEVYAIAEMLRRFAGGAAVVMGALSPRTRNAQVAMFEAGEVDYLVATDAIGMGLNLSVTHVAFASLGKFDGRRYRRLTVPEMAQIAGRAGRHQQDGSFGTIGEPMGGFTNEEVEAIEGHYFSQLPSLYWRNPDPQFDDLSTLVSSLEQSPQHPTLRAAPEAVDLAVLRHLAGDVAVREAAHQREAVTRLWDVCGLPDFEQLGAEHHSRTVLKLWQWRMRGHGKIDRDWFASRLARHSAVDGDIGALAAHIAAVRTLCFIAQRGDWLEDAAGWASAASDQEAKLSDALHAALAQRFVDRRLALLLRDAGRRGGELPVAVAADGTVAVDGEGIGRLEGFQFRVDPSARAEDHRLLLAAAERHLTAEFARRLQTLAACDDKALTLSTTAGEVPYLYWQGHPVARLARGALLTRPAILLEQALKRLDPALTQAVQARLAAFVAAMLARHAGPLQAMSDASGDLFTPPSVRALLAGLADGGGQTSRHLINEQLAGLAADDRRQLKGFGLIIGSLDLYHPTLLKPEAVRWRAALLAVWRNQKLPTLPAAGAVCLAGGDVGGLMVAGFRPAGDVWLRVDMVERLARQAHAARQLADTPPPEQIMMPPGIAIEIEAADLVPTEPPPGFAIDAALATSLGLSDETRRKLLTALGFKAIGDPQGGRWRWSGKVHRTRPVRENQGQADGSKRSAPMAKKFRQTQRQDRGTGGGRPNPAGQPPKPPVKPKPPARAGTSPFAGLADLLAAARKPT